jgi:hypothetical protein
MICFIIESRGFIKKNNIMLGWGRQNQLIHLSTDDTVDFYIMERTSKVELRLEPAFGFGHHVHEVEQISRYLCSPAIALRKGACNPEMTRKLLC